MNEFVEECRREWKRLGVSDPIADEMAAELAADLAEAEADGVAAEEVLGSGAFDPRSFAAAWAAERDLVQRPQLPSRRRLLWRSRLPAAIAAMFALVAIVGAVLVIPTSSSGTRRLGLPPPPELGAAPAMRVVVTTPNAMASPWVTVMAADIDDSGDGTHTVGSVLLIVGLAGSVPLTLFSLWAAPGGWPRRRTRIDDRPSRPAY